LSLDFCPEKIFVRKTNRSVET